MIPLPYTFPHYWLERSPIPIIPLPNPILLVHCLHHLHPDSDIDLPYGRWARFEIVFFFWHIHRSIYIQYIRSASYLSLHLLYRSSLHFTPSIYTIIDDVLRLIDTVPTHQISLHIFCCFFFLMWSFNFLGPRLQQLPVQY
jgi:hypothetical protein